MIDSLEICTETGIDRDTALRIYQEAKEPIKTLELFKAAYQLKSRVLGNRVDIIVPSGVILKCKLNPPCRYCSAFKHKPRNFDAILQAIPALPRLGINKLLLVGGANMEGYDEEIIELVGAINRVSSIKIEINFGASLSRETVQCLKKMNVIGITSSLEVLNEQIFNHAKPGDSLEQRKGLLQIAEDEGLSIRSFMMLGLGETDQDRIEHLFYLKSFKQMKHLVLTSFTPSFNITTLPHHELPAFHLHRYLNEAFLRLLGAFHHNHSISTGRYHTSGGNIGTLPLLYFHGRVYPGGDLPQVA